MTIEHERSRLLELSSHFKEANNEYFELRNLPLEIEAEIDDEFEVEAVNPEKIAEASFDYFEGGATPEDLKALFDFETDIANAKQITLFYDFGASRVREGKTENILGITTAIYDEQKREMVFIFNVEFTSNDKGERVFHILNARVGENYQGKGILSKNMESLEDRLKGSKVNKMEVETGDIGGYAWAKLGFDFMHEEDRLKIISDIRMECERSWYKPNLIINQENFQTAKSLAEMTGETDSGKPVQIGKELMVGTFWEGQKYLDE